MKRNRLQFFLGTILIGILLFGLSQVALAAGNSNGPADVPATHWAYKAVKLLLDKGYLQLYQDQTFQGDKPVDRFTLATVVARILNEVAVGQIGTSKEDVVLLRKLTNEFQNELVELSTKSQIFDKKMEDTTQQQQVIKEDLTKTNATVQNLSAEQIELQKEVQQMIADIQDLKARVKSLEDENAKLKSEVANLENGKKQQNIWTMIAVLLGVVAVAHH